MFFVKRFQFRKVFLIKCDNLIYVSLCVLYLEFGFLNDPFITFFVVICLGKSAFTLIIQYIFAERRYFHCRRII